MRYETDRLVLRPPEPADFQAYWDIHADPEVLAHTTRPGPGVTVSGSWLVFASLLGHWQIRGYGQWTVVEKTSDEIIGRVGLWHPEGSEGVELGWVIRRSRWGNGFATEAARTALSVAFDVLELDRVVRVIQASNTRSIRIAEKLGQTLDRTEEREGSTVHVFAARRDRGLRLSGSADHSSASESARVTSGSTEAERTDTI